MRSLKHILTFCFAVFIASTPLFSAHIIGGEMTYNCLGNDNYRVTIKLYRDAAGGGAEFDVPGGAVGAATITVYRGSSEFINLTGGIPATAPVPPDINNPCLIIPPNISVGEGVYTFDVNLPQSNETYTISYQRCCRNSTITNILNPGEIGATYTVDVTPEAQSSCNSSPAFNSVPPIVVCAGTDINFDFSATDPDGDLLVYELCAPFNGGGNDVDNPFTPGGVSPNPDTPPPYSTVNFAPGFSALAPMQGDPEVSINSSTGLITGTPVLLGQYAVGVCVFEFRNGVLLSTVRRDFQFNVAECEPTVVAEIQSDEILDNEEFRVISCGENTVSFVNESYQESFIDNFYWEFDINGTIERIEEWSPTVEFPEDGIYNGVLILNEGTTCADTAVILVEIYPDIFTDFEYEYDTCVYGPVDFTNLSFSNAGPNAIVDYLWDFGDGTTDTNIDPSHLFAIPGNLPVSLTITDINDCVETYTEVIEYFPVPTLILISPSTFNGCTPAEIFFDNLSVPIDSTYDITWDFGDGTFGTDISPTHIYDTPGTYTIAIEITSPIGCYIDTIFPNLITIRASPEAGFTFTPEQPNNFEPTVSFTDESTNAVQWKWDIDDGFYRTIEQNPVYTFQDTGIHVIQQVVIHESGCTDTLTQIIDVEPQVRYFLPNAFTPNFDGINDEFRGDGVMAGATDFSFEIWNRYGELIFETADPFEAWNGQKNNSGKLSQNGVYVVVVSYLNPRGERIELKGFATLIQ